jgi:hypothetical protein
MKCLTPILILSTLLGLGEACNVEHDFEVTFFGFPDNSPPGPGTAHNCGGRNHVAGGRLNIVPQKESNWTILGTGTFHDPVWRSWYTLSVVCCYNYLKSHFCLHEALETWGSPFIFIARLMRLLVGYHGHCHWRVRSVRNHLSSLNSQICEIRRWLCSMQ